jgi:hypothetical protein
MIPKSMDRRLEGAGEFRASEPLQGGVLSGSKQTLAPAGAVEYGKSGISKVGIEL